MLVRVLLFQLAALASTIASPLPAIGAILGDTAVVMRDKREPSRSLTFSGFMPGSGMSAFASTQDFTPYFRPRRPQGPDESDWRRPPEPSPVEQPPERGGDDKPWAQPADRPEEEEEEEEPAPRPPKKKKKYSPKETNEDEEEYEKPIRGGGNAAASFNAWFPIMLGMFPPSRDYAGHGEEGGYGRGSQASQGSQGGRYPPASHTTVIANSVSHGRSGVASSHAVAYGGGGGSGSPHRL